MEIAGIFLLIVGPLLGEYAAGLRDLDLDPLLNLLQRGQRI